MFTYCNNNPTNCTDPSGELSVTALKCIVSVVTSILCDIATQASIGEIIYNATVAGAASVWDPLGSFFAVIDAFKTVHEVIETTGDWGLGLFMGGLVIATSFCTGENIGKIPRVNNLDKAAEIFLDATVGLTASLVCAIGTYEYTDGYVPKTTNSGITNTTCSNRNLGPARNFYTQIMIIS